MKLSEGVFAENVQQKFDCELGSTSVTDLQSHILNKEVSLKRNMREA